MGMRIMMRMMRRRRMKMKMIRGRWRMPGGRMLSIRSAPSRKSVSSRIAEV